MAKNPKPRATKRSVLASLSFPACWAEKIAEAMVCVFPGMFPASVTVAPNSPNARVKPRIKAAASPRNANGKV